jgi:hypothetical protein
MKHISLRSKTPLQMLTHLKQLEDEAFAPMAVTFTKEDEIDISRA